MRGALLLGAGALALTSTLALAQPQDLLPDIFNDPPAEAPAPRPQQTAAPAAPAPQVTRGATPPAASATSAPVVQPLPSAPSAGASAAPLPGLPANFPSLAELEQMEEAEINELLGLRPKFDVPPAARRSMERVGVIASSEGGFPYPSLARQPAGLVRAALEGTRGPMVSRWGHILVRRALASRLDAPAGMSPVEFAALRAAVLNRMGEARVAVELLQDVDGNNYDAAMLAAASDAYLATGDLLGLCPLARLHPQLREDGEWVLTQAICDSFLGETRSAERRLARALGTGEAPEIDVRLAQRFAGAAGDAGRAVNIEWAGVDELTPWRLSLARALGVEIPDALRSAAPRRFDYADVLIPAVPLAQRLRAADRAGRAGVLSAQAMVDLYSLAYANEGLDEATRNLAAQLRQAYVASEPADRLAAMRALWGEDMSYGRLVLTAYAAARLPASNELADDAGPLIAAMLAAGLDANAMRWRSVISTGSEGWALLALADPAGGTVSDGDFGSFVSDDDSEGSRKSAFLLAGLAGLGRMDAADVQSRAADLGIDLSRESVWSQRISQAARVGNPTLVALLAGVGMQGDGWNRMTARHLYHIVRSLNAVGLSAEARMIAAEAVARG
ncbi:hypothetical protein [Altererythrobacter lauratis]|uniref:Uncharacterized protein n=1 Tax=Alteraurantiacibacter lauratis TaxID=2054627 RepID=A0ABV7EAM6_9SPHN